MARLRHFRALSVRAGLRDSGSRMLDNAHDTKLIRRSVWWLENKPQFGPSYYKNEPLMGDEARSLFRF